MVLPTFQLDRDIDLAAQDVRDRVAAVLSELPQDTRPPLVAKAENDSAPILTVAVAGDRSLRELTEIADKIVRRALERSAGVGEVLFVGGLERAINIWLDADRLSAYRMPIARVRAALQRRMPTFLAVNVTSAKSEQTLRTLGRITDPKDFNDWSSRP